MKNTESNLFKKTFLNLRWLIVIAAGYMAVFPAGNSALPLFSYINLLVFGFITSNILLYFISAEYFKKEWLRYTIFIGDIILVSLVIYFTGSAGTDFFLLYFLVIIITALGKDLKVSVIATVVASVFYYGLLAEKEGVNDINMYMRIPFLFVVGLFTGFLSESVKKEEENVKGLRFILAVTDIMNENINLEIMAKLLDPFFAENELISDWEIAIYENKTRKFLLLREDVEIGLSEMSPEFAELLIRKSQIYKAKEYVYFPQSREKQVIGFLRVKPKKKFLARDYDFFMTLAGSFAIAIERNTLYNEIRHLASIDRLTDLYNYGYFLEQSEKLVKRNKDFAVIMIDLDNFKAYNDTYGHVAGNTFLRRIAYNFKEALGSCVLARYGGDEFIILRQGKNEDIDAYLKEFQAAMNVKFNDYEKKIVVTMSIGYARFINDKTAEGVISRADRALYKAKQNGKNTVAYL
ncbi:MAG: GGDEF domain-containing protein [Candidatus Firestonebacteria bacterium]|nr:GGDEF domain-containing protein [Candidatus Firestonebacteria bacterium]